MKHASLTGSINRTATIVLQYWDFSRIIKGEEKSNFQTLTKGISLAFFMSRLARHIRIFIISYRLTFAHKEKNPKRRWS
jgi:hypothetical protein